MFLLVTCLFSQGTLAFVFPSHLDVLMQQFYFPYSTISIFPRQQWFSSVFLSLRPPERWCWRCLQGYESIWCVMGISKRRHPEYRIRSNSSSPVVCSVHLVVTNSISIPCPWFLSEHRKRTSIKWQVDTCLAVTSHLLHVRDFPLCWGKYICCDSQRGRAWLVGRVLTNTNREFVPSLFKDIWLGFAALFITLSDLWDLVEQMNNSSFHLVQLQRILNPHSPWARVSLHWELLLINKLLYSPALVLYSLVFGREESWSVRSCVSFHHVLQSQALMALRADTLLDKAGQLEMMATPLW